jgi:hypothetical protein
MRALAADQMPDFTSLHTTCSTQLPVEPLLRAVIDCGVQSRVDAINSHPEEIRPASLDAMIAAGWTWQSPPAAQNSADPNGWHGGHAFLQENQPNGFCALAGAPGQGFLVGTLSLVLPVDGTDTVDFGNDYHDPGTVVLAINGVTVAKADPSTDSVVTSIDFHAGDVLTLQDQGYNSVIRLNSIELMPEQCMDNSHNDGGGPCAFPFTYSGRTFTSCTTCQQVNGDPCGEQVDLWCSKDHEYQGRWEDGETASTADHLLGDPATGIHFCVRVSKGFRVR